MEVLALDLTWSVAVPAGVGAAAGALAAFVVCRTAWRRLTRARKLEAGADSIRRSLCDIAEDVQASLDARIERLEGLLRDSRDIAPELPRKPHARLDAVADVSAADRSRVLELAELGQLPDAIAESVGLLRGEVDLILRLHRSAGRVGES